MPDPKDREGRKILLVAKSLSHIALFHMPVIRMLKEEGWSVDVAGNNMAPGRDVLDLSGVDRVFVVDFHRKPLHWKNVGAYREMRRILREGRYDVVHCHTLAGGFVGRLAALGYRRELGRGRVWGQDGIRVLYTAHGFHFFRGGPVLYWILYYPLEKWLARFTDTLVVINGEDEKRAARFPCPVIRMPGVGVDTRRCRETGDPGRVRTELGVPEGERIVLAIGELNRNKRMELVIRAFLEVGKKVANLRLVIAGTGPREERLKCLVRKIGLEDRVVFAGFLTELYPLIRTSELVVSGSRREGLPVCIQEAMACGKPVVVTDIRGHRDLVEDGVQGFLVQGTRVQDMARAMERVLRDRKLAGSMGDSGRRRVEELDVNTVREKYRKLYHLDR